VPLAARDGVACESERRSDRHSSGRGAHHHRRLAIPHVRPTRWPHP
jgi:hypothetical protein